MKTHTPKHRRTEHDAAEKCRNPRCRGRHCSGRHSTDDRRAPAMQDTAARVVTR